MAETKANDEKTFKHFLKSGIYSFNSTSNNNNNIVFMDSVRVLNRSYTHHSLSPSTYYSRFFPSSSSSSSNHDDNEEKTRVSTNPRKRKKGRSSYSLNERELSANQRHQEARPILLRAHEVLLEAKELLMFIRNLKSDGISSCVDIEEEEKEEDLKQSLVELGNVWQAPLYEISIYYHHESKPTQEDEGSSLTQYAEPELVPVFNNLVVNETCFDAEAGFLNNRYIIPAQSYFYMIHDLIPAKNDNGFNLIVIDPPWENGSASQKSMYPTLPNRYFLSLPIKQLTHTKGALVALWVTNREKLRIFVEKELFPTWGVNYAATLFWLKVKGDGSLIGELDLFHHRPYECLLLGYCHGEEMDPPFLSTRKPLQENQVIISVPGEYSRKPPVGKLLLDYVPGPKPARCIELFARELFAGWTCWGNEPLHFQESRNFVNRKSNE